jgi:hypothetical protein
MASSPSNANVIQKPPIEAASTGGFFVVDLAVSLRTTSKSAR